MTAELARALGGEMPKSLEGAPRISTGGSSRVNPVAPTLVAGAATDAGVVRGSMPGRSRSRLLVLLAIVVVVPPIVYVGLRSFLKHEVPTALVPADPSLGASIRSNAAAGTGAPSNGPSTLPATPPTPAPPDNTVAAAVNSAPGTTVRPH